MLHTYKNLLLCRSGKNLFPFITIFNNYTLTTRESPYTPHPTVFLVTDPETIAVTPCVHLPRVSTEVLGPVVPENLVLLYTFDVTKWEGEKLTYIFKRKKSKRVHLHKRLEITPKTRFKFRDQLWDPPNDWWNSIEEGPGFHWDRVSSTSGFLTWWQEEVY